MPRAFASLAFTPAVRDMQEAQGSARMYDRFLADDAPAANEIGPDEAAFLQARDGFYQATVSETGWPYVQFRGGPRGFLQVLDAKTVAFADFRGNRQYVSAGNLKGDDRVSMIFMDYPNQRRLKLLGRVALSDDADLIARLMPDGYRAKPERAVVITVEALDWNCPSHIPQRMTVEEYGEALAPLQVELSALRAENKELKAWMCKD